MKGNDFMYSIEEQYLFYKKTIQECGSSILLEEDIKIEYILFEEFSSNVVSYLSEKTLKIFEDIGWIDEDIYAKSRALREKYFNIEKNRTLLNADAVRVEDEWNEFLLLSDELSRSFYW